MSDLLTTRQLMDLLQVDRTTIYRMLGDGQLPAVRVGGQWRFQRQAIEAWLDDRTAQPDDRPDSGSSQSPYQASASVLPLHCLQPIQEVFAHTAGIGAVTTGVDGEPLTAFSNACAFCSLILATENGRKRCQESWKRLADETQKRPALEKCHAGLAYARGWINVGGRPVAMIFAGQFVVGRRAKPDAPRQIAELARACELSPATLDKAARQVVSISQERADHLLLLLQMMADTFSTIGQERVDLLSRLKRVAEIAAAPA